MGDNDGFNHWAGPPLLGKRCRSNENESEEDNAPPQKNGYKGRESHREVEKRRRDRMRQYLKDLENVVIDWNAFHKKPSKINLLRETANYVRSLGGPGCRERHAPFQPSILSDEEFKNIIAEGGKGFLFKATCDTGHILDVTDTVSRVLNRSQQEWLGTTIYDQVHISDVERITEHLSIQQPMAGRILDLKTGTMKKEFNLVSMRHWNERRNFVCRMKVGSNNDCMVSKPLKAINRLGDENYAVVYCSGIVRYCHESEKFCMIAIGRTEIVPSESSCKCENNSMHTMDISNPFKNTEFVLKLLPNEKIVFADERVPAVLGYQSHELLDKSCFDFIHIDDYLNVKTRFQDAIKMNNQEVQLVCRFKTKNSEWIYIKMIVVAFTNPFSNVTEFIICTCSNDESMGNTSNEASENIININNNNNISGEQYLFRSKGVRGQNLTLDHLLAQDP